MSDFEPRDANYVDRVRKSFASQAVMQTFGIRILDLGPGWIELGIEARPELTQQDGYLHAGVVATALDSACGYAAYSLMPSGVRVLTSEYKITLLRPVIGDAFVARGSVIKPGRTLTVSQAELAMPDGGPPLAIMTGTLVSVE